MQNWQRPPCSKCQVLQHRTIAPTEKYTVHLQGRLHFSYQVVLRLCHACVAGNFLRPVWSCGEALENFKLQWLVPVCMSCPSSCLCDNEGKTKTHHSTKLARVIEARTCKDPRRSTLKSAAPRSIHADGTKMVRKCTAAQVQGRAYTPVGLGANRTLIFDSSPDAEACQESTVQK